MLIEEYLFFVFIIVMMLIIFVVIPIGIYYHHKKYKLKDKSYKEFVNKIIPGAILECTYYEENPFLEPYVSRIKILEVKEGCVKFEELIQNYAKDSNNIGYYSISELDYIGYNFV